MIRPIVASLISLAAFAFSSSANAVVIGDDLPVIDRFTRTVYVSEPSIVARQSITHIAPAGAIGDRRVSISATEGRSNVLAIIGGSAYFRSTGRDTVFTLEYGVSRPLDLILPGDAFKFDVLDSDLDDRGLSAAFSTTLTSGAGVVETVDIQLSGEGEYVIPFSLFDLTDFNDVDYITFSFDTTGIDRSWVVIGPIVDPSLPEPATVTLFGFGVLGLLGAARSLRR